MFKRINSGNGGAAALCVALCLALVLCVQPVLCAAAGTGGAPARLEDAGGFGFAEPYFEETGSVESLPDGIITALAQDSKGLLWIGTQQGLVRYDGYRFRRFSHRSADPTSLAGDYVTALWAGHDGRLWIGTYNDGLSVFDPGTETFRSIGTVAIDGGRVWALAGEARGGVWVASDNGLEYWPPGAATPLSFRNDPANPASLADNRVRSLLVDRQGTLWVGGADGLQRRRPGAKGFERVASDRVASDRVASDRVASDRVASDRVAPDRVASEPPPTLAGKKIMTLFEAADGKIWIGTGLNGAAWLAPSTLELHLLEPDPQRADHLSHGWIKQIAQPRPDRIWLGTYGGGANILDAVDGTVLQRLRHDPSNPGTLALDSIGAMLVDRAGLLWIGTWGGGLQRHNPANRAVSLLRHSPARPSGLSHPGARCVLERADGSILVGSGGNGIDILDRRLGLVGGYRPRPGQPGALGDGTIHALATAHDGALWAATQQAGVFRLAPGSNTWQSFSTGKGLPAVQSKTFLSSRDGTLWVGTDSGVARWVPERQRFDALAQADGSPVRVPVRALAEDARGRLWVASMGGGLWVKEPGVAGLRGIGHDPKRPDGLANNYVIGLLADSKGRLWVATARGLSLLKNWDGSRATFEHIDELVGMPGKSFGGNLLEDAQGRIWTGDFLFDPKTKGMVELSKADGFDVGAGWFGSHGATRDGLLLQGGSKGIAVIDPSRFQPWSYQPVVQASELALDGKPAPLGALTPGLTLDPDHRSFTVGFTALDFSAPQKNRYAYRLLGYDRDWIETDSEHRSASYGNLRPGGYTLQVRGTNRLGEWSEHRLIIPVTILPAFWQTTWFLALGLLAMSGMVYGAYRLRVATLHARARELQGEVGRRTADIVAAHGKLEAAHGQLETAHIRLKDTQRQMLLQGKMAGLGTLTAGVAHEINNPTNFTHVAAQNQRADIAEFERFVRGLFEPDEAPETVQAFSARFEKLDRNVTTMLNGTERIKRIVADLRSFTRPDEADTRAVRLSECLALTLNLVRNSWGSNVEFISEISDDPEIECWPALLNQVFMSLLVNACQAVEAKRRQDGGAGPGHVWMRLWRDGEALVVEIEDDGAGIDPEVQTRIMDPFFTTKEVGSGTGLGLSVSFGIVQKHGGALDFTSTPGRGSCFSVRLPLGK